MRVTYNWLKAYVKIALSPEKLAEKLTMAGLEVTGMEEVSGDQVMELEVTTNRPDWLSIVGVVREVGAITGKKINYPDLTFSESSTKTTDLVKVRVEDPKACPRYTARVITGLKNGPSPDRLKSRLEISGIRSVNLIVDITNFVLMELGQPLHAFDLDKLAGPEIIVRRAKSGEKLLMIDGAQVELKPDMLAIADAKGPLALAGVMGGKDSEVDETTKAVLLESAYFDPMVTRKTAKSLGISTESSFRFERGVDPEGVLKASDRACYLLETLGGGKVARGPIDVGNIKVKLPKISLKSSWANRVLGTDISSKDMERVFTNLQLNVLSSEGDLLEVEPPSFRRDLTRPIDLVEEIGRVYSYQNVPSTYPAMRMTKPDSQPERKAESMAKEVLVACGLSEVISYSLIAREMFSKAGLSQDGAVAIQNPLSRDQALLRAHLLPGVLKVVCHNKNRNIKDIKIFELGTVYHRQSKKLPKEVKNIVIAISGNAAGDWKSEERPLAFYDLKGIVAKLLSSFGITDYDITEKPHPSLEPGSSAALTVEGKEVGFLGKVSKEVLAGFEIDDDVLVSEIRFYDIIPNINWERKFEAPLKYPSVTLDLALIVADDIQSKAITSIIRDVGGELVKDVRLFDVYHGSQVPAGHTSTAYSIEYQATDRTLTEKEVKAAHSKICENLKDKLRATIR